jgi:antitoxin ParD1/3/4
MATVEKLSVALTPEMAAMVKDAVRRGEYASASEVFRDALRYWKAHQDAREREVAELRRLWQEGIASGAGTLGDMAAIKAEARRRLKAAG